MAKYASSRESGSLSEVFAKTRPGFQSGTVSDRIATYAVTMAAGYSTEAISSWLSGKGEKESADAEDEADGEAADEADEADEANAGEKNGPESTGPAHDGDQKKPDIAALIAKLKAQMKDESLAPLLKPAAPSLTEALATIFTQSTESSSAIESGEATETPRPTPSLFRPA